MRFYIGGWKLYLILAIILLFIFMVFNAFVTIVLKILFTPPLAIAVIVIIAFYLIKKNNLVNNENTYYDKNSHVDDMTYSSPEESTSTSVSRDAQDVYYEDVD